MRRSRPRAWLGLGLGLILLLFAGLLVLQAQAAEFRSGNTVVIGEGEIIDDDLFISADRVLVKGTVNGDLWVGASHAEVLGTVNGSLFFAGRDIDISGNVLGSVYTAGSVVVLSPPANITRNLYFVGYGLRLLPGAFVGRDALAAGNQALIAGQVTRNVSFSGSALDITGTIGGDVTASVSAPGAQDMSGFWGPFGTPAPASPGLRVGDGASIGGRLTYRSPEPQPQNIRSQPAGGVTYQPEPRREREVLTPLKWVLAWLRLFGTLLALGAVIQYGFKIPLDALAEKVLIVPLLSAGWGILIILAGFAAAAVAFFLIVIVTGLLAAGTFGGLAATVFFGAGTAWAFGFTIFLLAVIFGSRIVVAYLLGLLVLRRLAGRPETLPLWLLIVGTGIYALAESIPFFGAFVSGVATVLGFGAIYITWQRTQGLRPLL